jgi:gamma-glutamyltranspeptidase / glutathione hydrolase
MSPTIVLRRPPNGNAPTTGPPSAEMIKRSQPVLTVGAAGGPMIITQVVGTIVRRLDFGMDLDAALAAARLHHQWRPNTLFVDRSFSASDVAILERRGHVVRRRQHMATVQAIAAVGKTFIGAHDPDVPGKAAGW